MTGDDVDNWYCPSCGFEWGGKGRAPPFAWCPSCRDGTLRRGYPDE